jgi:hypothetical protein
MADGDRLDLDSFVRRHRPSTVSVSMTMNGAVLRF